MRTNFKSIFTSKHIPFLCKCALLFFVIFPFATCNEDKVSRVEKNNTIEGLATFLQTVEPYFSKVIIDQNKKELLNGKDAEDAIFAVTYDVAINKRTQQFMLMNICLIDPFVYELVQGWENVMMGSFRDWDFRIVKTAGYGDKYKVSCKGGGRNGETTTSGSVYTLGRAIERGAKGGGCAEVCTASLHEGYEEGKLMGELDSLGLSLPTKEAIIRMQQEFMSEMRKNDEISISNVIYTPLNADGRYF